MPKYELKTKSTDVDPQDFINSLEGSQKEDCNKLLKVLSKATGATPKMWGQSVVGFGSYAYETKSGCSGVFYRSGFAARKNKLSVHVNPGYWEDNIKKLLPKLGKHKAGVSCITINKLSDINLDVLEKIVKEGWKSMAKSHPESGDVKTSKSASKSKSKSQVTKTKAKSKSKAKATKSSAKPKPKAKTTKAKTTKKTVKKTTKKVVKKPATKKATKKTAAKNSKAKKPVKRKATKAATSSRAKRKK